MKLLQRFRVGDWVLGYIPKGYSDRKHIVLFQVTDIDRKCIGAKCQYAMYEEYNNDDEYEIQEQYWNGTESEQAYEKNDWKKNTTALFRLTHDEAMMLLVESV